MRTRSGRVSHRVRLPRVRTLHKHYGSSRFLFAMGGEVPYVFASEPDMSKTYGTLLAPDVSLQQPRGSRSVESAEEGRQR